MQQDELPLSFPELPPEIPLAPVRMVNEYVYCPRLAYLEWVQGEFAHSADTVEGRSTHRRVDRERPLPEEDEEAVSARSVWLSSRRIGITGKLDLVEAEGEVATPVDYKRGKRPHVEKGAYDPERVQVCAQGLLLREHGFRCDEGVLYFAGSRERVRVPFDAELVARTREAVNELRGIALGSFIPPPLEDSPKCPRCSLIGICLPDEVHYLKGGRVQPRQIYARDPAAVPLYVQESGAYLRKSGERIFIEVERERVAQARLPEVSQIVLYGRSRLSTPLLHECMRREIPVTFLSHGGWFMGHITGIGHRNVDARILQYRSADDTAFCLRFARELVAVKIANCRTILRRNWHGDSEGLKSTLRELKQSAARARRARSLDELLGIEGSAAYRYFRSFPGMFKVHEEAFEHFDFQDRNRRPPKDPTNALLSFAYAMLTREWNVALSAVGLDAYRGFYHQPRFGRTALSLDMMEPFRPLVSDSTVLTVINNGEIKPDSFIRATGSCALKTNARRAFIAAFERRMQHEVTHPVFGYRISYRRLFEVQARMLIRLLQGEIDTYPHVRTR